MIICINAPLEAAGAQRTLVNSHEQNPAPTPTHARFALKSCAWSSPHLVSKTNAHRELGAQLLPGPSTFQLFHNLGNVQGNQPEILGPFTPRGFDFSQNLHHKHEAVLRGGAQALLWAIFIPDAPPQEAPTNLAKLRSFELWRFKRGEFPHPFTQCNYSNRESSPTGLSSTADMLVA